jgi:hypothetical protein
MSMQQSARTRRVRAHTPVAPECGNVAWAELKAYVRAGAPAT